MISAIFSRRSLLALALFGALLSFAAAQDCGVLEDSDIIGRSDEASATLDDEDECCELCQDEDGCSVAVWDQILGDCYLIGLADDRMLGEDEVTDGSLRYSILFPDGDVSLAAASEETESAITTIQAGGFVLTVQTIGLIIAGLFFVCCLCASFCVYRRNKARDRSRQYQNSAQV